MTKSDDDFHAALRAAGWTCMHQEPDPDGIPVWQLGTVWGCHEGSQPYESLRRIYEAGVRAGMGPRELTFSDALLRAPTGMELREREPRRELAEACERARERIRELDGENSRGEGREPRAEEGMNP